MPEFLLFNPETSEIRGPFHTSRTSIHQSTEGGAFKVFELETSQGWRTVENIKDENGQFIGVRETYDFGLLVNPILQRIEADADEAIAARIPNETRARLYAAKEAEARNPGGPTPMLDAEAKALGTTTAKHAAEDLKAAEEGRASAADVGRIEGERRAKKAAIEAAGTVLEILKAAAAE